MNDYQQLSGQFHVVRNSWKRAAALSGLSIMVGESIGILTVLLFLDWLFKPLPGLRVGMWMLALAGIVYFFARHVLAPLWRQIPDEQIALYIEEHRSELDGVLITAAEYGGKGARQPGQAALIEAVMREAASRSEQTVGSQVVDLSRLKKYGLGAAAGLGIYVIAGLLFPDAVGHHIGRILNPWKTRPEDLAKRTPGEVLAEPIRFTFSKGDASLARGTSFEFEAALSRAADKPVLVNFRPRAQGDKAAWQQLPMTEIEKLNGFKGTLADISEDLEFYVSSGADKSDTHLITVFDPLVVQTLAATTHYPDYVKLPDRVENPSTGDVEALVGSKVTVKILTTTALKHGQIKWGNGQTQDVTVDPAANSVASFTFEVKEDGIYDYALADVNGQQAVSAAPLSVKAIPDVPPTIEVKSPQSPVLTTPLGEVNFDVAASDDFGVAGVDLVSSRVDADGQPHETRVPLTLKPGTAKDAGGVQTGYLLALEDAKPLFKPNDAISYHLEARDAKGQKASSPIGFIIVGYFENWATWIEHEGGFSVHDETGADLMAMLSLVWELDNQKTQIPPDEVKKRSAEIAGKMVDGDGALLDFLPHLETKPQLARVAPVINAHIKNSHDALLATETARATSELTIAAALLAGNGILEDATAHLNNSTSMMAGSHFSTPQLTMLEAARLNALADAAKGKTSQEQDETQSAAAAAAAKQIEDLLKNQDALIAKAQGMVAQSQAGSQPPPVGNQNAGIAQAQSGSAAGAKPSDADLAAQQHGIAEKTRGAADKAKATAAGGNLKLNEASGKAAAAARKMEEASRSFAEGRNAEGKIKAGEARNALKEAGDTLHNTERDKLEVAISSAESAAAALLEKQSSLRADTEASAKELGGSKTVDQRQQRDLQKQAFQQTKLRANAETLNGEIADLGKWADQVGKPEVIRSLAEAQKIIKRSQPETKMANALIDLNAANPAPAVEEQKKAEDALGKIIASLRSGADALAASRESQLRRAARTAAEVKANLAMLGAKGGADAAKGGADATKGGADAAKGGADSAKGGANGPGTQGGAPVDRHEVAQKVAYDINRLTAGIDNRQLVPQEEIDRLKEMSMDKNELEKRLAIDPKFLEQVSDVVAGISNKIEAEMEAKTEARKLFSSQREECPPAYRQFVNQYFEVLSQVGRPPEQGKKP